MNRIMIFLVTGLLVAGCSVGTPIATEPATEAYMDAELEDEWDEDAPNWRQPDDYAVTSPSDEPVIVISYFDINDGQSDDEWDEDAPNWRHAGR